MRKKTTKPFGVWADSSYVAKVDDNDKVYRKIAELRVYYQRLGIKKSTCKIAEELKDFRRNPFWAKRMSEQSAKAWEKHFYRSEWYHRRKRKIRP